ncbi:MAG: glycosyltransferase family 9 protein [Bryobacteraceae bacterium]|jgi:ADP-heptose:LPS heptosyltransferase
MANLRLRLLADYYGGGILHALLKPPTILLGKVLRRDHSLERCADITFVKLLGGGSLAVAYPALLAIKNRPHTRALRLLTTPSIQPFGEVLGLFDEIIVVREHSFVLLALDSFRAILKLFRCDAIVDLEIHSRLTTVFSLLTCARNRVGFYTSMSFWRKGISTHLLFCNIANGIYYFYDQIASLFGARVSGMDASVAAFRGYLGLTPPDSRPATRQIGLAPCCSDLSKERMLLPEEWMEALGRRLGASEPADVHLLGAPAEVEYLDRFAALIRARFPAAVPVNHAGKASLRQSVCLLAGLDELDCIDSALFHFARLLGIPTVSFWGPTDPRVLVRPSETHRDEVHYYKLPCSPCVHLAQSPPCFGDNLCMRFALRPEQAANCNPPWVIAGAASSHPKVDGKAKAQ